MLRTFLLSAFLLFCIQSLSAQNLVPNGSFESYVGCPDNSGLISLTGNWYQHTPNCTPDFYHACAFPGPMQVPTLDDTIYPFDGDGMARVYLYANFDREYISTRLSDPLQANHEYAFSVQIRLFNDGLRMVGSIGALVSQDSLTGFQGTCEIITTVPQMQRDSSLIMDQEGIWYHYQDTMTAVGGEEYLNIGNFRSNANTPVIGSPFGTALYLLDDVRLTEIVSVGVNETVLDYSLSPNPAQDFLSIQTEEQQLEVSFQTVTGQLLKTERLIGSGNHQIDLSELSTGIYLVRLRGANGERVEKLVVN